MEKLETGEPVRRPWWAGSLMVVFFVLVALGAAAILLAPTTPTQEGGRAMFGFLLSFGVFAAALAKRRGRSGWWFFVGMPIGFVVYIILKVFQLHWLGH